MLTIPEQRSVTQGIFPPQASPPPGKRSLEKTAAPAAVAGTVAFDYVTLSGADEKTASPAQSVTPGASAAASADGSASASTHFRRQLVEYLERQGLDLSATHDAAKMPSGAGILWEQAAPVAVTTANGTAVAVSSTEQGMCVRLSLPDGQTAVVDGISSDVRFTRGESGELLMVTEEATYTLDAAGNKVASAPGGDPLTGGDGDDIILNFTDAKVQGGGGDDLIITYANRVAVSGGAGDDTVVVAGKFARSVDISLGDGNDRLEMGDIMGADIHIDAGLGDDELQLGKITGESNVSINGGGGDDTLFVDTVFGRSVDISGGDGNDRLEIGRIRTEGASGRIDGGAGDDKIFVDALHGASVLSGSGNDVIHIGHAVDSVIDGGDGSNEISVETMFRSLLVNGVGDDAISIDSMLASMILSPESLEADFWETRDLARSEDGDDAAEDAAGNGPRREGAPVMDMGRSFEALLAASASITSPAP